MPVADLHARCFICSSSSKRRPWSAFFRGPKFGCRKVPNRQCREDVREQFTPLLQSPPLSAKRCAVALSCRRKTRIIFLFSGTLWIRWFYLFNLCTYRSELTSCTFLQEPYQISTSALSLVFLVAAVAGRLLRGLQTMARNSTQFHIETKKTGASLSYRPSYRKTNYVQIRVTVKVYTRKPDILNYMWMRGAGFNNKQYADVRRKILPVNGSLLSWEVIKWTCSSRQNNVSVSSRDDPKALSQHVVI